VQFAQHGGKTFLAFRINVTAVTSPYLGLRVWFLPGATTQATIGESDGQGDSDGQGAGVCPPAGAAPVVDVRVGPDNVPDLRCLHVRGSQRLRVTNGSGRTLHVVLGQETQDISPGAVVAFRSTFGVLPLGHSAIPGLMEVFVDSK
jgi:hypothetical protein